MTAESLRRAGNPTAAVDLCRDALIRFPGHLSARVTLGWALLDLGKLREAQQEFEAVRRQAPDNLAAIRGLAKLHTLHDGDGFQEADQDFQLPEAYEDTEAAAAAAYIPPPAPVLPPAPVQWSAPLEPSETPEMPETPETLELFEPLDERDMFDSPLPGLRPLPAPLVLEMPAALAAPAAPQAPSPAVFRLERWLERVEVRRAESLTECA